MAGQLDNKYGDRESKPLTGVAAPTSETKASYTIQTALKLEAKALGILGNAVTVKAEANTSDNLAVSVTGNSLTILLANATGSKNTMTLIAAAIAASTPANALVNAIVITGATQMTAFTVQSLTGGLNGSTGYLSEIRYDTNGTKWEMKYTTADCYYWSPDGFPAVNTQYVDCYDSGLAKIVYKMYIEQTSTSGGTEKAVAHGISGFIAYGEVEGNILTPTNDWAPNTYYGGATSYFFVYVNNLNVRIFTPNSATFNSRPVKISFKYTKD